MADGTLLRYRDALNQIRIVAENRTLECEEIELRDSIGRILAEDLTSREQVPGFDNSAMDGFAVRSTDLLDNDTVEVLGTVFAGEANSSLAAIPGYGRAGSCIEIMTGAILPSSTYDAVVKIEDTERISSSQIRILKKPSKGENVRCAGEDYKPGSIVLKKNTLLQPHHLLPLASLGITQLKVKKRLRVAIIPTGNELVRIDTPSLKPGEIRNSTSVYLDAALRALGHLPEVFEPVADDPAALATILRRLAQHNSVDIVITTGAVSMGKHDFIKPTLQELGAEILFHKVAIRPGKPILFARYEHLEIFGLPGNPVSTAVGLRFFVEPYLRGRLGFEVEMPTHALIKTSTKKPEGLRCFFKARLEVTADARQKVTILSGQASFMVSPLTEANAWVVLSEEGHEVKAGDLADIYPLLPQDWIPTGGSDVRNSCC